MPSYTWMNWVPPTIWFDGNSVKIDVGFRYRFASDTQSVPNWLYGFKPIGSIQRKKWRKPWQQRCRSRSHCTQNDRLQHQIKLEFLIVKFFWSREPALRCNSSRQAFPIACCRISSTIRAIFKRRSKKIYLIIKKKVLILYDYLILCLKLFF